MSAIQFPGGFCVLMALYYGDKPVLFEAAVRSVFLNTVLPNQFIVVVDGPITTKIRQLVETLQYEYPLIEFIYLPKNLGLAHALNKGFSHIRHSWVVRADSDDFNLPQRFEILANILSEQPDLKLFGSAILEVDECGAPLAVREVPCTDQEIRQFAKVRNPFNHMTVAFKLDAALACGGYPNIFLKEDYALWALMLSKNFPVHNTTKILVYATAGIGMFKRRGGLRYAKSELELQKLLFQCGLKGLMSCILDGCIRAIFFLIPSSLRGLIYLKYLRKKSIDALKI